MNSSAKILFTLVAAGALGAVAIACSVSSGTVDDTDGGSSSGKTSSSSGTVSDGGSTSSSGAVGETCPTLTYASKIENDACDQCIRESCCTEAQGCLNHADNDDAGALGCDGYGDQLAECDGDPDPNGCKKVSKTAAQSGIPAAWDTYIACRANHCADKCGDLTTPPADGGAP